MTKFMKVIETCNFDGDVLDIFITVVSQQYLDQIKTLP